MPDLLYKQAMIMKILSAILLLLFLTDFTFAQQPVRLTTKIWPPYHYYDSNGKLIGKSVQVIECAFAELDMPFAIDVLPWKRAQAQVKEGFADGFFSASLNKKRDLYATRSIEIAPQNWVWYTLKSSNLNPGDEGFKSKATVAGTLGSNILTWLHAQNYNVTTEVKRAEQLIKMLKLKRFDAFMGNEFVVSKILDRHVDKKNINSQVARSMPVGVYYSHQFLASKPGFLKQFNAAVRHCHRNSLGG